MTSSFFILAGSISILFGNKINYFTNELTSPERFGIGSLLLGASILSLSWLYTKEKGQLFLQLLYLFITICLTVASYLVFFNIFFTKNPPYKNILIYFIPFFNLSILMFLIKSFIDLHKLLKKLNKQIDDPIDKLTILVAIFGVLISAITFFK